MFTESQMALAVSIVSLTGSALNVWLKHLIHKELQQLSDRQDGKFQSRELCAAEMKGHETRLVMIEQRKAA